MAKFIPKKKARGKFLTIWIAFYAISLLYAILQNEVSWIAGFSLGWAVYATITHFIGIVELYGIWVWKRWGIYLLAIHQVVAIAIVPFWQQTTAHQIADAKIAPQLALGLGLAPQLLVAFMWFWAIRRKWQYFA